MLGPATYEKARLPWMIEPPSTSRRRGTSATYTGRYETWKRTLSAPHQERDDEHVRERERVECVRDRDRPDQERAAEVGRDHDPPLARAAVGPGARVEREEEVRRELGGDEIPHLGRARVEGQDGDERQGDQADLVAEQRDGLTGPEAPELAVLTQERRHPHRGDFSLARCRPCSRSSPSPPSGASPSSRSRTRSRSTRSSPSSPFGSRSRRSCSPCRPAGRMRSLGRRGWIAGVALGLLLALGLRAPDGRARADDRLERRLHHRPLRRLHAAPRARCSSGRGSGRAVWLGVALAVAGLAHALGRRRRRPGRRCCSCSPARRRTRSRSC